MSPVLRWWDRLPSPVRWVIGIVYSVGTTLLLFGVVAAVGPDDWSLLTVVLVGAVVSSVIFFPLGIVVQARRLGGWHQLSLWRRAYRTGDVAPEAAVDRWLPIARRNLRYFLQYRAVFRVVMAILSGLLLVVTGVGIVAERDWRFVAVQVPLLLFFAGMYWAVQRLMRWRIRQFERLVPKLEARSSDPLAGGSSTD